MNVLQLLQSHLRKCLTELYPDQTRDAGKLDEYVAMLKPAQSARFGDYQANCAMPLAKVVGKPPRDVAQEIAARLDRGEMLEEPEVAGPGFINLRLRTDWLARQLQAMARDGRLGVEKVAEPKTFVIDYSSPNVAKPMHVGHLRSTIIGDALARLLRFLGHKVIADNHLGDWGTQFGMILWGWKHHRDEEAFARDPVAELARLYRMVSGPISRFEALEEVEKLRREGDEAKAEAKFKEKFPGQPPPEEIARIREEGRALDEAARAETAKLHAGDPENRALWERFMPNCLTALQQVYDRLDIHFDEQLGESAYDEKLPGVVEDLRKRGLAEESKGAIVVFVKGLPIPFMVQKSDGAFNYATTDLATIEYREKHFHPDVLLYVVDHRQGDHFRALFDVARRWGYGHIRMEHVAFGTVLGRDRRPYKTREGDVVGLESLLDEAVARARQVVEENSPELSPEERGRVAEAVGIGAVKYADLSQHRASDYTYDPDKMMAMDGNTATYMQYAYARNKSIFRKGEVDPEPLRTDPPIPSLEAPEERALALQLLRFSEALASAVEDYRPSQITAYLWDLAKSYSGFFTNCPVLKAETPELRQGRLLLCDLTARVIQKGLDLLGIRTAERM